MRLLFVSDAPTIGGPEVHRRDMLPRLRERGLHVEIAYPDVEGNKPVRDALSGQGITVHAYRDIAEVPNAGFDRYVLSAWSLKSWDKFYAHFPGPNYVLVHDQLILYYPYGLDRLYRWGYRLLQAPNLRRADRVITVSKWAARYLEEVYDVPDVMVVPNGADLEKFRPAATDAERDELRRRFAFTRFSLLCPARLSFEKNQIAIVNAAKRTPEVDFYLVGDGELRGLLERMAAFTGVENVHFLGRRFDMPELYRAADAMILPSYGENQSRASLEAMASGLPVVSGDIPAQAELITDGVEGLLVEPNEGAVARAARALSQDPERVRRMGRAAREKVARDHTFENSLNRLIDALTT